jgi:glutaredoxin
MVKVYLSRAGVPFTEHNVSIDEQGKKELLALGRSTTPVTVIGSRLIVGYKPRDLADAIAALGH